VQGKGEKMKMSRLVRLFGFTVLLLAIPASSFAGVFVSVAIAPPALPVYVQPPCPGDGYIWTPGYWAYGPDGYYWVPGTWVVAPEPGLLWTPGYWGWNEGAYVWHAGYWGPHIGFYGGVNYGFGYFGVGYAGGYWQGRTFFYNRSVNNVTITNVHIYNKTVVNNVTVNRVSYNGGRGGINARPGHTEEVAFRERRFEHTNLQVEHERNAGRNRELLASVNHGRPSIAATQRPGEVHGHEGVRPGGAPYRPNENRAMDRRAPENRAMNHDVSRPQGPSHNMDRPMPHQNEYGNRNAPREQPRGPVAARPSAYHPESHARENGPRGGEQDRGHGPKH
jgi:WXXGXW repeat (2 copies)